MSRPKLQQPKIDGLAYSLMQLKSVVGTNISINLYQTIVDLFFEWKLNYSALCKEINLLCLSKISFAFLYAEFLISFGF